MVGETDLGRLLAGMAPELSGESWGYACVAEVPGGIVPFALIREAEGLTVIAPFAALQAAGIDVQGPFARITLRIHSSLAAVGLTAAVSSALAQAGISANMVAGYHHDHILLAAADTVRALAVLEALRHG